MWRGDRRKFIQGSGLVFGSAALTSQMDAFARVNRLLGGNTPQTPPMNEGSSSKALPSLCNNNIQTAIGLGDETPGIIDQFGQLDSRNATFCLDIGGFPYASPDLKWSQALDGGYFPIVHTEARSSQGSAGWTAYATSVANADADCLEISRADLPLTFKLWLPFTTEIAVNDGIVTSGDRILAVLPVVANANLTKAKYNLLTPARECWSLSRPPWSPVPLANFHPAAIPGLDPAFSSGRSSYLFRPLRYGFPVQPGKTYHVVLGLVVSKSSEYGLKVSQQLVKLSAEGMSDTVDMANLVPGRPFLREFVVKASGKELHVTSETDPSSTSPYRYTLLNAIWIFDEMVDLAQVQTGSLSDKALFYVRCGEEPMADRACSVTFDVQGAEVSKHTIYLPYDLNISSPRAVAALRAGSSTTAAKPKWETLIQSGAQFITGDSRLDNLYRTSLINIFLLRTRYPGAANQGQDLFVVKPGASIYDAFWYRDGAYLTAALGVAGHSGEAEKSLRLFWQTGLPGNFGSYEQQECGAWQAPLDQSDGQGQVLWALVHHFQLSGNLEWLRVVYPNIRKGADWIRNVTGQPRFVMENGERPIYYGLLPAAEGEAIGHGYIYYHDFWAVLGLRMAIEAAKAMNEEDDLKWMAETYDTLCANLSASVKLAFERVGGNKYIPATPFHSVSQFDIWGSIAALYPTQFLEPHDPMISQTLDLMRQNCQEDEYTYFNRKKIWTYITVDWAMCYMLRDDLDTFFKLFDGYVAHASPTNGWTEEMFLDTRQGTGDMPHGWAAAQYVHLHRNSLVYEDGDVLHLCWGAREAWLSKGIKVHRAPTKFGTVDFELSQSGETLLLDYRIVRGPHQERPRQVELHLPSSSGKAVAIRINGAVKSLLPDQRVIQAE